MSDVTNTVDQKSRRISIQLLSSDTVRNWSYGEVTKPETINYRSFKPEFDGLFCEKTFGPVKNWECHCGKYKRIRYRGVICDRCGVEVTHSKVRRERMGHIELSVPIVHILFFKTMPSTLGNLLGLSVANLEKIIYYEAFLVLDPGDTDLTFGQLITEEEYIDLEDEGRVFDAKIGGVAIKQWLVTLDLDHMSSQFRDRLKIETSMQRRLELLKRLRVIESLRNSENRPEWMVLDAIPIIPPDLRPLVPLDGGRFATSDLNDLYRRVINRNNRLKKLIDIKAPEVILRNEKRMLQEAVDVLFGCSNRSFSMKGETNRPLKSLSELLKGKQGRFRQNLLGKRVDYSGRSVIVVEPHLKIHQCGLPKPMALELYKPFIIQKLEEKGLVHTIKSAKRFVDQERSEVWDILEEVIDDHPVLLNRAPTLHRLGIQAFYPKLVEGKAIKLHPLVCTAFNADFDGDQMAVYLPLSFEAQLEARVLMISSNNILHPASGQPIVLPSQDILLGCFYLTSINKEVKKVSLYSNGKEVIRAYEAGVIELSQMIKVRIGDEKIETTAGRIFFNEIVPEEIGYVNESMDKKAISRLVDNLYRITGNKETCEFLDNIKSVGFKWSTLGGLSVSASDMIIPDEKYSMIEKSKRKADHIRELYENGTITDGERYNQIIDLWSSTSNEVADLVYDSLAKSQNGFNPVYMMAISGARGNREQIKQLSGMRGLMQKPQKKLTGQEIIENPILSCFIEGLNVIEYFISTHGSRKGLADTALKTADAGYLTRRLVDVAQDVIVTEEDCETVMGIDVSAVMDGDTETQSLSEKILGRVASDDVYDPMNNELICEMNVLIDEAIVKKIMKSNIHSVKVRSVLTCESRKGICAACYGRNLASGRIVDIGEAVGVVAAQSIGEPGTQLTLRTFHIGGVTSRLAVESSRRAKIDSFIQYQDVDTVEDSLGNQIVVNRSGEVLLTDSHGSVRSRYTLPYGALLKVKNEQEVKMGELLFEWDPYNTTIITRNAGKVELQDMRSGLTYIKEYNEETGLERIFITTDKKTKLHPHLNILDNKGEKIASYALPAGSYLLKRRGDKVQVGDALVKIPKIISGARDITGGLPRVAELFEARKPKNAAVVTTIDGIVNFEEGTERGQRRVKVTNDQMEQIYLIPQGKHITVYPGDRVQSGDKLCEGSVVLHDILRISGDFSVQKYLVQEVQSVYKLQGVIIADKHIECIVRQMMKKVKIVDPGDTHLLEGQEISKTNLKIINEKMVVQGKKRANFQPTLLGITKSSLGTDSFVSAASFQETTKVLMSAAIEGRVDKLEGLKENVIMGNLIPSGTGNSRIRDLKVLDLDEVRASKIEEAESQKIVEELNSIEEIVE